MENTKKTVKVAAGAVGGAGAVAAACAACCASLPLVAPLLAWLGLSGLSFATIGWSLPVAGAAILALTIYLVLWRRRRSALMPQRPSTGCGCASVCPTRFTAGERTTNGKP